MKRPTLIRSAPLEEEFLTLRYNYLVVEMSDLTPEDIRAQGRAALLPLLPLTRGGMRREMVEQMLQDLEGEGKEELREVGFILAWLKFARHDPVENAWLKWRYKKMFQLLRQEPLYSEILREGRQEGVLA